MRGLKCLLFGLLFAASSTVLFTDHSVSALASDRIDTLYLTATSNSPQCFADEQDHRIDISRTWASYFTPTSDAYNASTSTMQQRFDPIYQKLQENMITGSGWGVIEVDNGEKHVMLVVWDDPTDTLVVDSGGNVRLLSGGALRYVGLTMHGYWDGCKISYNTYGVSPPTSNPTTLGDYTPYSIYFLATDNIQYDADYTGGEIPTGVDLEEKPRIRPDFTYKVVDKEITATDDQLGLPEITPDEGYTIKGYSVEWTLTKCVNYDADLNLCGDDPQQLDHKIQLQSKKYEYTVLDHARYRLSAQYLVEQCYRYPSYPATPDHCFYTDLQTELPDYNFTSTTKHLNVDGSTYMGNTKQEVCDQSGSCVLPPDGLGFFRGLDSLNTFGLQKFFVAPIEFYGTLPAKTATCEPINIPFLQTSFSLECLKPRYYDWSTTIMTIYVTILTAAVGYLIAFNIFRTIKDIQTPDKDGIEVAKL